VRIDIGVAGGEIVVNRDHAEDVYVALRDAFDAANRKLEDYARKLRGDVKKHESRRA
jgi:ribosome-associated translation inhibitor RaiA